MKSRFAKPQVIRGSSGEKLVVVPFEDYEALIDANTALEAKLALALGGEELLADEEINALLELPTPLAFWRKKRGLSQVELAEKLGVGQGYVSDLESGRRIGAVDLYAKLAEILSVAMEDLLPSSRSHSKRGRKRGGTKRRGGVQSIRSRRARPNRPARKPARRTA
jgi:transcriptional regulator with XRE-family HTH domain